MVSQGPGPHVWSSLLTGDNRRSADGAGVRGVPCNTTPAGCGSKPAGSEPSASSGGQEGGAHGGRVGGSHLLPTASPVPEGSPTPNPGRENALRHRDTKDVELADLIHVHRKRISKYFTCNLEAETLP